jgi:hypothetical protein
MSSLEGHQRTEPSIKGLFDGFVEALMEEGTSLLVWVTDFGKRFRTASTRGCFDQIRIQWEYF